MIVWTRAVLSVLYACILYFCICTCSAQLSMFHPHGSPSRGGGVSWLSLPTPFSPIFVCPSAYRNLSPVLLFHHQLLRHICSFLARTVLSVYTGLSPIFLFCTSLLFATSPFLTHFQSLEVGRCLPSGRGENRASTHNDKHGCVAFRKSWWCRLYV